MEALAYLELVAEMLRTPEGRAILAALAEAPEIEWM